LSPGCSTRRASTNQNSRRIRDALVGRRDVVVLDVPYRRKAPMQVMDEE